MQVGMKTRHFIFSLLPALALADNATMVPDDEPMLPPLPEELLHPQTGSAALPATAQPVVSYRAPKDEEQTWLKLLYVKDTEEWPSIFRRMASASHEKDMEMCHGYALWLKGQPLLHLRYDDDLSLSGIHADGHAYGVLFVEFSPWGIRVCPMEGYDLTGKNGGVCWQDAATRLWSWAEAEAFWAELPRLLKADKGRTTSAHDTAVKREVATLGQRMVVFWAPAGYPAKSWWAAFSRLHAAVGPQRFSLVAADGLNLWTDVTVPSVKPSSGAAAPATPAPAAATTNAAVTTTAAPTPITAAPPLHAATGKAPVKPASETTAGPALVPATPAPVPAATPATPGPVSAPVADAHPVPENLQPASGTERSVAPAASVRPWAMEGNTPPASAAGAKAKPAAPSTAPAPTGTAPAAATSAPAATAPAATTPAPAPPPAEAPATPSPSARGLEALPTIPH